MGKRRLYACAEGHIFAIPTTTEPCNEPNPTAYNAFKMIECTSDDMRTKTWAVVEMKGHERAMDLYNALTRVGDMVGVSKCVPNIVNAVVRKRRMTNINLSGFPIDKYYTLRLPRGNNMTPYIVRFLKAWLYTGTETTTNFDVFTIRKHDLDLLRAEWDMLPLSDIHIEIATAKSIAKEERSARDALVISAYPHLLAARRT